MHVTQANRDRLADIETNVIPAFAEVTDEALEDRAVALETRRKADEARLDIGPCFQIRTRPQRPREEVDVVDGDLFIRAHEAAKLLDAVIRRACARLYRRDAQVS